MLRLADFELEPSDQTWLSLARRWATEMGFQAGLAVAHGDKHIHVVASHVRIEGSVVSDQNDFYRSEKIVRQLEEDFGLARVRPSHLLERKREVEHQKTPSKGATAVEQDAGVQVPSKLVAAEIDRIFSGEARVTMLDFISELQEWGIELRPNVSSRGKMSGFAYRLGDALVTSRSMGRAYTWSNLQKRGLVYDSKKDLQVLLALLVGKEGAKIEDGPARPEGPAALYSAAVYTHAWMQKILDATGPRHFIVGAPEGHAFYKPELVANLLADATLGLEFSRRFVVLGDIPAESSEQIIGLLEPTIVVTSSVGTIDVVCQLVREQDPPPTPLEHQEVAEAFAQAIGANPKTSIVSPVPRPNARRSRIGLVNRGVSKLSHEAWWVAVATPGELIGWATLGIHSFFQRLVVAGRSRFGLDKVVAELSEQRESAGSPPDGLSNQESEIRDDPEPW
tara:strand:- start:1836 stop:3188 length:1353 start_codon:yes stop_codon:yes gene_type:complete